MVYIFRLWVESERDEGEPMVFEDWALLLRSLILQNKLMDSFVFRRRASCSRFVSSPFLSCCVIVFY